MFEAAPDRNAFMLKGPLARCGYDWWWQSFTARHARTGAEKAFFVEYFLCNPALAQAEPHFGDGDTRPSYGMLKVGAWGEAPCQIHNFAPWSEIAIGDGPLQVSIGQSRLSETAMSGSCSVSEAQQAAHPEWASDVGAMRWDLTIDKQIHYSVGYGASVPARTLNLFEMFWHAEGIKTLYSGWVELNGERYEVTPETSFGYADKNWGGDFTSPWLWISSCDLVSRTTGRRLDNSAVEIGGGRPVVLGVPLERQLLAYLAWEGRAFDFNFSRPWERANVTFTFTEGETENRWAIVATRPDVVMELDLTCPKAEMQLFRYQAPNGSRRHTRLWNGGTGRGEIRLYAVEGGARTVLDIIDIGHAGCEYGEYDATRPY